eukprot:sb/3468308/
MLESLLEGYWLTPLVALIFIVVIFSWRASIPKYTFTGKHVAITGWNYISRSGSSGIGLSVAIAAIERGANITLIARDSTKLENARQIVLEHSVSENQIVAICSVDIKSGLQTVKESISQAEEVVGKCVDVLVNCAALRASWTPSVLCLYYVCDTYVYMLSVSWSSPRDSTKLENARQIVLEHSVSENQIVAICSVDIKSGLQTVKESISQAEEVVGKCVDVLVNCAALRASWIPSVLCLYYLCDTYVYMLSVSWSSPIAAGPTG